MEDSQMFRIFVPSILLGWILMSSGCETSPEVTWQETMNTQVAVDDFECTYRGHGIQYEKGYVDYTVILARDLNPEESLALVHDRKLLNRNRIRSTYDFYLDGEPLELRDSVFPDSGSLQFGDIAGDPLPDWLLEFNAYLQPLYEKARTGNAEDAYQLGLALYEVKNRVHPQVAPLGFFWVLKAAERNHPEALMKVAYSYRSGNGVAKDLNMYNEYLGKARELGFYKAFNQLAWDIVTTHSSTTEDLLQARTYAQKAVEAGDEAGHIDTLATVEARLGNWDAAIQLQTRIIERYEEKWSLKDQDILTISGDEFRQHTEFQERLNAFKRHKFPEELFY